MFNSSFWPGIFACFSVAFAAVVLVEFAAFVAKRYRERYLQETGTELDDVLIQIPAGRILDLSLGLSVFGACVTVVLLAANLDEFPWKVGVLAALVAGLVLFPIPRLVLRWMKARRLHKFELQLEDALGLMSSSLKAGFSINQALDEVASQNIHPVAIEFRLLMQEIQLGVPLEQALQNMCNRLGSADFELVASAIMTARQTGGELTYALSRVAELIRGRVRIANKVRALTAMGKLQAIVIACMPFILMGAMFYISPQMMWNFVSSPLGMLAIGISLVLVSLGFVWIRKITRIEV